MDFILFAIIGAKLGLSVWYFAVLALYGTFKIYKYSEEKEK